MTCPLLVAPVPSLPPISIRRRPVAFAAGLAAAALLAAVTGWTPRIGAEHAAVSPRVNETASRSVNRAPLEVTPVVGQPGSFSVGNANYHAAFDDRGFSYLSTGASTALRLSLTAIRRGERSEPLERGPWSAHEHVASRTVSTGITEQIEASPSQIEWNVGLSQPLAGQGDLTVRARLAGVIGARVSARTGERRAWQLELRDGSTLRMGEIAVKDADGRIVYRGLPTVRTDEVALHVPASVLDSARYPLTVDPTVTAEVPITQPGSRYTPSVAYSGFEYLVVWMDLVGGFYDIYGSRISGDGTGVGTPFRISFRADDEEVPDVAWNGNVFLVVWEDHFSSTDQDIRGREVNIDGVLVGAELAIDTPTTVQQAPAVTAAGTNTAGGSNFFVTWRDFRTGEYEIYGKRLNTNGTALDGDLPISADPNSIDLDPDVAWNGSVFMVVWQSQYTFNHLFETMVRIVGADGGIGARNAVALWDQNPHDPAVASNGSRFLVLWEQTNSGSGIDIYGADVNPNFLTDYTTIPISTAPDNQTEPAVAYNGTYLVAWRDRRAPPDPDVYAARIAKDDSVQDPNGFAVSNTTADEDSPAVSPAAGSKWAISYESGPGAATGIKMRVASK